MMNDFEAMTPDEQEEVSAVIQLLIRQTYLLEYKYDRRLERMQYNKQYRTSSKHLPFISAYFQIMGTTVKEDSISGVIYLTSETLPVDKISENTVLYLLVLKLIFDEQMAMASTSSHVYTTLGEIDEKLGSFGLLKDQISMTEKRKIIRFLKKYQIVEALDYLEELEGRSRFLIYPAIHMVLQGEQIREMLNIFAGEEERDGEAESETEL